jgi:hypothetical protein
MKKFNEFYALNESGIQGMKDAVKEYKEAEIYFHMDTDGVTSALAMKEYLRQYGVKVIDAHIIQYGGQAYAIKHTKSGALPVLVDFAHSKPFFKIHTDHHDSQAGVVTKATSFKHARSNAETLSAEVSPTDVFTHTDIDLINTVDSADFLRKGVTPEMVSNSIFKIDPKKGGMENRFLMGFVVNRLLLAYKSKEITGTSLDGKTQHKDRNFLEALVLDCSPSLYSMYANIKHYIKNFTARVWNKSARKYEISGLATPEELSKNLFDYQERMKDYENLKVDDEYKIAVQYGGGKMFDPGAYDRYTIFKNYPDINFYSIVWPIGLIQVSCNPFKEKELSGIHLGDMAKDVMEDYKTALSKVWISIGSVKKEAEGDMEGLAKKLPKQGRKYDERVGFKFDDLKAFYTDMVYKYDPKIEGNFKLGVVKFDEDKHSAMRDIINKRYSELSPNQKKVLDSYKIKGWDLIMGNSGGHPSITNLQGWNYLKYAAPKVKEGLLTDTFGSDKYTDIMKFIQGKLIDHLKELINQNKSGDEVSAAGQSWGAGAVAESFMKKFDDFDEEI